MWVIGDIHGCINTLKKLCDKLNGEIYTVGDLVDKGPSSSEVIDFVIKNNIKAVKGNHDVFFQDYGSIHLQNKSIKHTDWYLKFGGNRTIHSYKSKIKMEEHINFISSLPYHLTLENAIITHGFGLPYINDLTNYKALTCNRITRYTGDYSELEGFNIFGHDSFKEVLVNDKFIGIDTGCVYGKTKKYGGKLSAYNLKTKEIVSVDLIDNANYSEDELC